MSKDNKASFTIDDKTYTILLTANGLSSAEALTGLNLWNMGRMTINHVRALVYAGINGQHEIKKLEDVGELLDLSFNEIVEAATEAYTKYFDK